MGWAVEGGADLIIGETFYYAGEALAALEVAKVERAAGGAHHRPDGAERDGRRRGDRGDLPTAGAGRRGRGRHELLPRPADDAAVAARDPRRRVLPRRCASDPLPDDRRRADVLQPQRHRRERALAARAHVPDRAGPAVREPLRGRRVRPGGRRDRDQLPRRVLWRVADADPPGRRGRRGVPPRPAGSPRRCRTTSCTATTSGCPSTSWHSARGPDPGTWVTPPGRGPADRSWSWGR